MRLGPYTGIVFALLVFVGATIYLIGGIHVGSGGGDMPPFHMDEAHKLAETFYYHLFVEQRDLEHPAWTQDFYARTNPSVGKYILGAVLAATGHNVHDQRLQDDFERMWRKPGQLRTRVPDGMLRITRGTSAVFGALVCALLFIVGYRVGGVAAGLIAALLVLGHPYFQRYAQRGLTDTILWFHLALIVPVSFWAASVLQRHWRRSAPGGAARRWGIVSVAGVLVPGLVIALAAGSKLNGALAGPVYVGGLILAALPAAGNTTVWRRLGLAVILIGLTAVVAVAIFIAVNPYFHHHPIARAAETMRVYRDWMVKQQVDPGGGLFSLRQKVTAAGYFALHGPLIPLYRYYLGTLGIWLTVLGFAVGAVHLVGRCLPPRRDLPTSPAETATPETRATTDAAIALCWIAICVVGITVWLPLAWQRYLLVPYLAVCLTAGIGLARLPAIGSSLIDVLSGARTGPGRSRLLVGSVVVVALWIVLSLTPWLIAPALLNPMVFPEASLRGRHRYYVAAVDAHPSSPVLHRHLGLIRLREGQGQQAAQQFGTALSLLPDDSTSRSAVAVQRCCLLYDLVRAYAAMGDYRRAADALRRHLTALQALRDGMVSKDPRARAAFDQLITERRRPLTGMTQTRLSRPLRGIRQRRGR